MATLHVRNVPDELYERLRASAGAEGRSIGAEAIALLRRALGERAPLLEGVRDTVGRTPSPFLRRFGASAREIVLRAQAHARAFGAPEVTPAHVLLAMLEDDELRPTLERRGITAESVRAVLPVAPAKPGAVPISAEARTLLERALLASLE